MRLLIALNEMGFLENGLQVIQSHLNISNKTVYQYVKYYYESRMHCAVKNKLSFTQWSKYHFENLNRFNN